MSEPTTWPAPYGDGAAHGGPGASAEAAAHPAPARPEDTPLRPEPLGVTVAPTGNADVDTAIGRLADADEMPTQSHIEVYEDVHSGLRDALAALDENRS